MKTVNISLPQSMYQKIESLLNRGEYASRSELLRTALRVFFALEKKEEPAFSQFEKTSIPVIKDELKSAGYSSQFVNSVAEGLKKSSVYQGSKRDED